METTWGVAHFYWKNNKGEMENPKRKQYSLCFIFERRIEQNIWKRNNSLYEIA